MLETAHHSRAAFRALRSALLARRWQEIDLRLRAELLALALLVNGFLFWQARVGLASLRHDHGEGAVASAILATCALLAGAGGVLAAACHAHHLRVRSPGPAWLSLPVAPQALAAHLRWEATLRAGWTAFPVPGILAAAIGLIPLVWLPLLALGFLAMMVGASRFGCVLAYRAALYAARHRAHAGDLARVLADAAYPAPPRARRHARWQSGGPIRALMAKDLLLAARGRAVRRRLLLPLMLAVFSVLVWSLPMHPALTRFVAFGLALATAATLGEWLIELGGADPFTTLRGLPVGVRHVWGARAPWALVASIVLVIVQGFAAQSLDPVASRIHLVWTAVATIVIVLLALNYGVTLFPDAKLAQRFFLLALGLSAAVSLMLPLFGWVALLAGLLHTARRLPRWSRLEESP